MTAFPDKATRIARLVCNDRRYKDVLVACMPSHDNLFKVHIMEVGAGKFRALSLALSPESDTLSQGVKLDERFTSIIDLIETYGYDCVDEKHCDFESLFELLNAVPGVSCDTAEAFYQERELATWSLLPIHSGLRVSIVIDDGVNVFDARTCKRLNDELSACTNTALVDAFKNSVSGRTVLEAFYTHGELKVTDVYRLLGRNVTSLSYTARMRALKALLSKAGTVAKFCIVEPVNSNEHALRILAATQSLLKPALLAKYANQSVLIDKYPGHEVEVSQVVKGESKISCFDRGPLNGQCIKMPVSSMTAYTNTYTLSAVRLGSQRLPILT